MVLPVYCPTDDPRTCIKCPYLRLMPKAEATRCRERTPAKRRTECTDKR